MSPGKDETRVCGYIYIYIYAYIYICIYIYIYDDDDRSGGERDSVQMSQRDMSENCYMTG